MYSGLYFLRFALCGIWKRRTGSIDRADSCPCRAVAMPLRFANRLACKPRAVRLLHSFCGLFGYNPACYRYACQEINGSGLRMAGCRTNAAHLNRAGLIRKLLRMTHGERKAFCHSTLFRRSRLLWLPRSIASNRSGYLCGLSWNETVRGISEYNCSSWFPYKLESLAIASSANDIINMYYYSTQQVKYA